MLKEVKVLNWLKSYKSKWRDPCQLPEGPLNFDDFDFHCNLAELAWLVPMENLQSLLFYPRGNMSHVLDGGVYDSIKKVKDLQQKICKEAKIKPPAHLNL